MAWSDKDLISLMELCPELRAYLESFVVKADMQNMLNGLQEHESNKNIHVTREEKANWNGIVNNLENLKNQIQSSVSDAVTDSFSSTQNTLDNHMNNDNVHVTKEEKDRWNTMTDSTFEGVNSSIVNKFEQAKAYTDNKLSTLKTSLQNGNFEIPYVNGIRLSIGATQPSSPQEEKDVWINTSTNRIYYFSNSRWNGLQ